MTSPTAFGPGKLILSIVVGHDAAGLRRVEDVRVTSTRPVGFSSALFVNRSADEIPALVGRLHALCGLSHSTAAAMAIAAARGDDPQKVAAARFEKLVAERLGEHLRSIFTGPLGLPATDVPRETLADLRAVLASARGVTAAAANGARRTTTTEIRRGIERLGLDLDGSGRPRAPSRTWAAEMTARVGAADRDVHLPIDPLRPEDDGAVIAGLAADPIGFAASPHLTGRRPETGPATRVGVRAGTVLDGRARLEARFVEIARAAMLLGSGGGTDTVVESWARGGAIDGRTGYAAVESPRGRLHHLVRLDGGGRVATYAVLAPTEWNFGPGGPFVATMRANPPPTADEAGHARVERIAAAFDPCVGYDVDIEDPADA